MAIQAATVGVMALKEADTGPTSDVNMASVGEAHIPRHGRPAVRLPAFHWKASDKYTELLNFEREITNILQTRAYEYNNEEKVTMIKNCI